MNIRHAAISIPLLLLFSAAAQAAKVQWGIIDSDSQMFEPGYVGYDGWCADTPRQAYDDAKAHLRDSCDSSDFRKRHSVSTEQDCVSLPVSLTVCPVYLSLGDFVDTSRSISVFIDSTSLPARDAKIAAQSVNRQLADYQSADERDGKWKVVNDFKENLKRKALPKIDRANLDLADVRSAQRRMNEFKQDYDTKLQSFIDIYGGLAAQAKEYKESRLRFVAQIRDLAAQGSGAGRDILPDLSVKMTSIVATNDQLAIFAISNLGALQRQILAFKGDYGATSASLIAAMGKYGVKDVDGTKPILAGIAAMIEMYNQSRSSIANAAADLQSQFNLRLDALIKKAVADQVKAARIQSAQLASSGAFLESNSKLIRAAWRNLPKVGAFPLLGAQFTAMDDLLSRESICAFSSSPGKEWMVSGCTMLLPEIAKVKDYRANTLSVVLQAYIDAASVAALPRSKDLFESASIKVANGDLRVAIKIYDDAISLIGLER